MLEPGPYARSRVAAVVERALREAGVAGVIPTPLDALRERLGIPEPEPMDGLGIERSAAAPRLLGAFSYADRRMYVERRQPAVRRRFTEAHELVHALCPWHEAALRLDTRDELFGRVRDALEAEANAGAGMLIFQGSRFVRGLGDERPSIRAALALAERHGASAHATIRHYVELHPRPVALLMVGRFPLKSGGLPLWGSVASAGFRGRFGSPSRRLRRELPAGSELHALAQAARTCGLTGTTVGFCGGLPCAAEAYYNRHSLLILLAPLRHRRAAPAA